MKLLSLALLICLSLPLHAGSKIHVTATFTKQALEEVRQAALSPHFSALSGDLEPYRSAELKAATQTSFFWHEPSRSTPTGSRRTPTGIWLEIKAAQPYSGTPKPKLIGFNGHCTIKKPSSSYWNDPTVGNAYGFTTREVYFHGVTEPGVPFVISFLPHSKPSEPLSMTQAKMRAGGYAMILTFTNR